MSSLFPFFAELAGRTVVVVGGGSVAARKVETLLKAGARITVVSPLLGAALAQRLAAGDIEHLRSVFNATHLDNAWFVVAATADQTVNRDVADAAHERRLWCNVVDDATLSSAQLPARVERGPLQVAISSGGASPMLARHLRERFEAELDDALGELATLLAAHRDAIRTRYPDTAARRRFFDRALRGELAALLRQGQHERARKLLRALLEPTPAHRGSVALVGAGPGDAGLLTLRALRVLGEADVILHDRLVSDAVLDRVRRDAERIEVGKQAGGHSVTQAHIHALMLEHARAGKRVVRLKGGDAFVFGRGGEELEFLRAHDIPYEVVPGITAALAAGAYAGIPLTHREHAQSLHLVTAHCANTAVTLDWASLAQPKQTVAFYMGVAALDTVRARLLEHGRAADTPFALVENASRPEQRVITGTLSRLSELATRHDVQSPALLVVGEVAALAGTLHWFGAPPLGDDAAVHSSLAHAA